MSGLICVSRCNSEVKVASGLRANYTDGLLGLRHRCTMRAAAAVSRSADTRRYFESSTLSGRRENNSLRISGNRTIFMPSPKRFMRESGSLMCMHGDAAAVERLADRIEIGGFMNFPGGELTLVGEASFPDCRKVVCINRRTRLGLLCFD